MPTLNESRLFGGASAAALLAFSTILAAAPVQAAQIVFDTDPFAGTTALSTPGRQVVGNELFLPSFDLNNDQFVFDANIFGVTGLQFYNGFVSGLPVSGVNLVVLNDTDNDANPATPFNAGTAANLIAAQITADGPGFFIYHNQGLGLNRLVFSTNLNDNTADLKILARMLAPTGVDAIAILDDFQGNDFNSVPEPATVSLLAGGAALAFALRDRARTVKSRL